MFKHTESFWTVIHYLSITCLYSFLFQFPLKQKETSPIIRASNTFYHQYCVWGVPRPPSTFGDSQEGLTKHSVQLYSQLKFITAMCYSMDIQPDHNGKKHRWSLDESICTLPYVLSLPEEVKSSNVWAMFLLRKAHYGLADPGFLWGLVTSAQIILYSINYIVSRCQARANFASRPF